MALSISCWKRRGELVTAHNVPAARVASRLVQFGRIKTFAKTDPLGEVGSKRRERFSEEV